MGTVLSLSPRNRKVYGDTQFNQAYNYAEQLNNVKNKQQEALLINNQSSVTIGHAKKNNFLISALNVGKHFSLSRKREKERCKKEKAAQAAAAQQAAQERRASTDSNKNISKSLSCYNLKSGTTTDNIEIVKNLSRDLALATLSETSRDAYPKSMPFKPPPLPPALPPKSALLVPRQPVKPIDAVMPQQQQITMRPAITLTSAALAPSAQPLTSSPSTTHRKTVIQVMAALGTDEKSFRFPSDFVLSLCCVH